MSRPRIHSHSPVLEYPPTRRVLQLAEITSRNATGHSSSLPSVRNLDPEAILRSMRSDTNPFTSRPFSQDYKSFLEKRMELPVFSKFREFCKFFSERQVIILTGGTGTGKTTQIPQIVAYGDYQHAKGKMIAVTQPRRVTAISVATRVAKEMDVELGVEVGYTVRFENKTTPRVTFLRYMTDGFLLHEAMHDPDFTRYSTIILDEAHERTVATDILMSLLKTVVKRRPDLKIIIMSATLDAKVFRKYFSLDDGKTVAKLLEIQDQSYPVEVFHIKQPKHDFLQTAIQAIIYIHGRDEPGDILLFLTGEGEIEFACRKITEVVYMHYRRNRKIGPLDCIPLYSSLSPEKQKRIFDPPPQPRRRGSTPGRKVIVATNIAESSLTIDGINFVIDCGFSKQHTFFPLRNINNLQVTRISKASAQQRLGRVGRTGPGKCFRLYTENEYRDMPKKTRPDVLKIDLSGAILKLLKIGIKAEELPELDFIDAPTTEGISFALETLRLLGAVDKEMRLTELGSVMADFPLDPRVSKALLESVKLHVSEEILTIAAMLSVQSVWRRSFEQDYEADQAKLKLSVTRSDHLTLLNVYNEYIENSCDEAWANQNYLSAHVLEEAVKVREQLQEMLELRYELGNSNEDVLHDPANVEKALLSGFYMHVAVRGNGKNSNYVRVKENDVREPSLLERKLGLIHLGSH
ncbi:pre-mRNA-splicing factor ATP-dependent RNA helicase PRP43 [Amanita muscaria]